MLRAPRPRRSRRASRSLHAHRARRARRRGRGPSCRRGRRAGRRTAAARRARASCPARCRARRGSGASRGRRPRCGRTSPSRPGSSSASAGAGVSASFELAARDRVAVRVDRGVAELRGDQLLELLRERVLEHLGLGVHLVPGHAEALDEEQLDEPVVSDHLERDAPAALGETDAAVALVLDEAERGELAQHPRDRGGADLEQRRELGRRGGAVAGLERVDRLRVVLDRGREVAGFRRRKVEPCLNSSVRRARPRKACMIRAVHDHAHGHRHGGGDDARRLALALALILAFMVGEVVAGILAHSLALLSDAAHMLTDAGALAMSLVVLRLAARPAGGNRTFGLRRSEILSAQANGAALLVLAGLIVYGAVRRLVSPPDARGGVMLVVALVGIGVNLVATWQLSGANRRSLNIEGSFQHLLTDLFAFIATAIAGAVILADRLGARRPGRGAARRGAHAARVVGAAARLGPRPARHRAGRAAGGGDRDGDGVAPGRGAGARPPRLGGDDRVPDALGARARRAGGGLPRHPARARGARCASASASSTRRSRSSTRPPSSSRSARRRVSARAVQRAMARACCSSSRQPRGATMRRRSFRSSTTQIVGTCSIRNFSARSGRRSTETRTRSKVSWFRRRCSTWAMKPSTRRQRPRAANRRRRAAVAAPARATGSGLRDTRHASRYTRAEGRLNLRSALLCEASRRT